MGSSHYVRLHWRKSLWVARGVGCKYAALHVSRVDERRGGSAEVLYDGCMSKSGCVYSFGVVLWELLAGSRAWAGLNHAQVRLWAAARLRRALA
jgi:hypothetical protein